MFVIEGGVLLDEPFVASDVFARRVPQGLITCGQPGDFGAEFRLAGRLQRLALLGRRRQLAALRGNLALEGAQAIQVDLLRFARRVQVLVFRSGLLSLKSIITSKREKT